MREATGTYVLAGGVKYLKAENDQISGRQPGHPCALCCACRDDELCETLLPHCDAWGRIFFVRATI